MAALRNQTWRIPPVHRFRRCIIQVVENLSFLGIFADRLGVSLGVEGVLLIIVLGRLHRELPGAIHFLLFLGIQNRLYAW